MENNHKHMSGQSMRYNILYKKICVSLKKMETSEGLVQTLHKNMCMTKRKSLHHHPLEKGKFKSTESPLNNPLE